MNRPNQFHWISNPNVRINHAFIRSNKLPSLLGPAPLRARPAKPAIRFRCRRQNHIRAIHLNAFNSSFAFGHFVFSNHRNAFRSRWFRLRLICIGAFQRTLTINRENQRASGKRVGISSNSHLFPPSERCTNGLPRIACDLFTAQQGGNSHRKAGGWGVVRFQWDFRAFSGKALSWKADLGPFTRTVSSARRSASRRFASPIRASTPNEPSPSPAKPRPKKRRLPSSLNSASPLIPMTISF